MDSSSDDPRPARPPVTPPVPGQPLPRLVRFTSPDDPPDRERERADRRKARSERRNKSKSKGKPGQGDEEKKGVLEEQTPSLDTYEARRTIRLVVGVSITAIVLIGLAVLIGTLRSGGGGGEDDLGELAEADPTGPVAAPGPPRNEAAEREARISLDDAHQFAQKQDAEQTLKRLEAVIRDYPKTAAADEARAALKRAHDGLPLFIDAPLVIARAPEARSANSATPEPRTDVPPTPQPAAETEPTPTAAGPGPAPVPTAPAPAPVPVANVALPPPPVTPEPRRETGLAFERANLAPRPLPDGFRMRIEGGVHPSGWPYEITCDKDGATMRFIPGGTFVMGRDDGAASERPAHRVLLNPYYMDQHEVTNRQFNLFLKAHGRRVPPSSEGDDQERLPAVGVTARDAYDYAQWAGKSLPTEAQWELAARTPDGRLHPWGAGPASWGKPRQPGQIDPVMSFPLDLSPYGVFDLAGNAREWTLDWFDPRYYDQFRGAPAVTDPQGPPRPRSRNAMLTIKGGSPQWESPWREGMRPEAHLSTLGFRCVLPLAAPAQGPGQGGTPARAAPGQVPF